MNGRSGHPPAPHVPVGVLGGRSLVGRFLLPRLTERGHPVAATSRRLDPPPPVARNLHWCQPGGRLPPGFDAVRTWIAICPIWATHALLDWLDTVGVERLVAISSTSLITKQHSADPAERQLARRIAAAEDAVLGRAARCGISATVLRPTMIYDGQTDGNVAAIAACVRRFGRFPLCGSGEGLRQPVHADDVARACVAAAFHPDPQPVYALSGGERLNFRELVTRTCLANGIPPKVVRLPPWLWRPLVATARGMGLAPGLSAAMGPRMNEDLVFDHAAAATDLGFRPRRFEAGGRPASEAVPTAQPAAPRT